MEIVEGKHPETGRDGYHIMFPLFITKEAARDLKKSEWLTVYLKLQSRKMRRGLVEFLEGL